jgi:hypothetical protein
LPSLSVPKENYCPKIRFNSKIHIIGTGSLNC